MNDLTVADVQAIAHKRFLRRNVGKYLAILVPWTVVILSVVIGWGLYCSYQNYCYSQAGLEYHNGHDGGWWAFFISFLILAGFGIAFSFIDGYKEYRFVLKFQQDWSDGDKLPDTYRS